MASYIPKDIFRAEAPGLYVALSHGRTHCVFHGLENQPSSKPIILCVHGINAEARIFDKFAEHFAARGRTLLAFDLYGRGYSDGTEEHNNLELFLGQITELLACEEIKAKMNTDVIDIVGSSLGGAIAAGFSARFPDRVRRCVLMAPAGLGLPSFGKVVQGLFKVPFIGRGLVNLANDARGLDKNMLQSFGNPTHPEVVAYVQKASERVKYISDNHPGYLNSFVSTVGHFPLATMQDDFRKLGVSSVPCLAVWGDKDTVVDFRRDSPALQKLMPKAELFVMEGDGHIDHFIIQPYIDQLHAKLESFLDRWEGNGEGNVQSEGAASTKTDVQDVIVTSNNIGAEVVPEGSS